MPIFRSLDLERMLIYQEFFLWKSAILHSIKLPFDVQAAEKNLTCYLVYKMDAKEFRLPMNSAAVSSRV